MTICAEIFLLVGMVCPDAGVSTHFGMSRNFFIVHPLHNLLTKNKQDANLDHLNVCNAINVCKTFVEVIRDYFPLQVWLSSNTI